VEEMGLQTPIEVLSKRRPKTSETAAIFSFWVQSPFGSFGNRFVFWEN
jgi:hypothetical protein